MIPRLVTRGRACPRCGARTDRTPAPTLVRLVRLLLASATYRRCGCGWRGVSV